MSRIWMNFWKTSKGGGLGGNFVADLSIINSNLVKLVVVVVVVDR